MKKPEKITDPYMRLMIANEVQNRIDDLDYLYSNDSAIDKHIDNIKSYFKDNDIPIPILPTDDRREGAVKTMYRVWAALDCNNMMCALCGTENGDDRNE